MSLFTIINEFKWLIIKRKLKNIKLVILDVDGVLTDGYLFYDHEGNQLKRFSVKDGLGIKYLQKAGIRLCIVSGGKEDVIKFRAKDLNIDNVYCHIKDKKEKVETLQRKFNLKKENTLYLGDDLNDLTVKNSVELLISPNNASKGLKKSCDAILNQNGGQDAVRELSERLLKGTKIMKIFEKEGFLDCN